jgi:hypothetical protein
MKHTKIFSFSLLILLHISGFAQNYTLSGYIRDIQNGEELIGANIIVKNKNLGATTNAYGFYSLTLPKGKYKISYSFIGYQEKIFDFEITADIKNNIELEPTAYQTDEVIISGERNDANVNSSRMSVEKIAIDEVKKLPAFMGEVDI